VQLADVALELLEMKLAAFEESGLVRGGPAALRDLHAAIAASAPLTAAQRTAYDALTDRLGRAGILEAPRRPRASLDDLTLDGFTTAAASTPPDPAERDEAAALATLAQRVWRADARERLTTRALIAWAERGRITARLIATTLRLLPPAAERRGGQRREPLIAPDDPLVSLGDPATVVALFHDLLDAILRFDAPGAGLAAVRDAMLSVARDPHAGAPPHGSGVGSASLRVAIEELERERLPEPERTTQRRILEQRRDEALAAEEQARMLLRRDVQRYEAAVATLLAELTALLPSDLGGGAAPFELRTALQALSPQRRLDAVPAGATTLTARLDGPLRTVLQGVPIAIVGASGAEALYCDRNPTPLRDGDVVAPSGARIRVQRVGPYVHLRWAPPPPGIAAAFAQALLAATLRGHERSPAWRSVIAAIVGDPLGALEALVARWIAVGRATIAEEADPRAALTRRWEAAVAAVGAPREEAYGALLIDRWWAAISPPADPLALLGDAPGVRCIVTPTDARSGAAVDLGPLPIDVKPAPDLGDAGEARWIVAMPGRVLGIAAPTLHVPVREGVVVAAVAQGRAALALLPPRPAPHSLGGRA
jgi:hypothetical protein